MSFKRGLSLITLGIPASILLMLVTWLAVAVIWPLMGMSAQVI